MYFEGLFRVQEAATSTTLHVGLSIGFGLDACLRGAGKPKWDETYPSEDTIDIF
jgi:hypothetical protein